MMKYRIFAAAFAVVAAAPTLAQTIAKPQLGSFGIDLAGMDKSVLPGDDFAAYVNGGWRARTEIPADQARWGGFLILNELSVSRTREVLEAAARDPGASPQARKAATLYTSFMDADLIERKGTAPLKPDLDRIAAIATPADLAVAFARADRDAIGAPIGVSVGIDRKNPDAYAVQIAQGGLGLPDRDYYLDTTNPSFAKARDFYRGHVARMLGLAGIADGATKAEAVFAFETALAKAQWSRVELRQAEKTYNPVATADLAKLYPGFDWAAFLGGVKLDGQTRVIVGPPSAIEATAAMIANVPLETWKAYLAYRTIEARASALPEAFVKEEFAFAQVLSGTPVLKERWKRGVDFVSPGWQVPGGMGEAVGALYVAKYFPPAAKAKADELVGNILAAMRLRIEKLTWMTPETKVKALAKLAAFRPKIGYPDKWIDYDFAVAPDDTYGNEVRAVEFTFDRNARRIAQPTDRGDWGMYPQTINAYANPVWNEIVFPAAILQPPFFDPAADDAVNYGAIGAVIGHEISHHFDDQGRKYDATGRLADWWTAEDVARFKTYTDRVVAQYSAYEPLPGVHVIGGLTLGENMADLAGLTVALDAYRISLKGRKPPVLDGYTGEQRFFMGFAQVWREKARDSTVLRLITTDPHTPSWWRTYVVRNVDAWYQAFDVKPGTKFYLAPAERIKVW